jgi:hypothetical protein
MNINDYGKVSHTELSKWLGIKPHQLKQTIQTYYKYFEDYGCLNESNVYYLNNLQCELAILFTTSSNLEVKSLFFKLTEEFKKFN